MGYIYINNQVNEVVSVSYNNQVIDLKPLHYRDQPFKVFFESIDRINSIPLNENLLIDLHDNKADSIEVLEYVLDESGELRYTEKEIKNLPLQVINKKYFISMEENLASLLSSKIEEFNYYGIEIVVTNQGKTQSHLFVYKRENSFEPFSTDTIPLSLIGDIFKEIIDSESTDISFIALDLNEFSSYNPERHLYDYKVPVLIEDLESLVKKQLIVDSNMNGILIRIESMNFVSDKKCHIRLIKTNHKLEVITYNFTLEYDNNNWSRKAK